jgi:hypothetical protein
VVRQFQNYLSEYQPDHRLGANALIQGQVYTIVDAPAAVSQNLNAQADFTMNGAAAWPPHANLAGGGSTLTPTPLPPPRAALAQRLVRVNNCDDQWHELAHHRAGHGVLQWAERHRRDSQHLEQHAHPARADRPGAEY